MMRFIILLVLLFPISSPAAPYAYMEGKVIRLTPQSVILQDPRDGMKFSIERKQVEKSLPKGKHLREGMEIKGHFDNVEFVPGKN